MLKKIATIAWKDTRTTFTDRNLLLIMLVTPIVLSTIIALALGDVSDGGGLSDIPVAVVNLDEGDASGLNNGAIFVNALVPPEDRPSSADDGSSPPACDAAASDDDNTDGGTTLYDLTDADLFDTPEAARQAVEGGDYVAAVIIPATFSQQLAYTPNAQPGEPVQIEIYADGARSISANVIRSVVESVNNQIVTGQLTIRATVDNLIATGNVPEIDQNTFACAFTPAFVNVGVEQNSIQSEEFNPLVLFGSAQAIFFALFTASGASAAVLEERDNWTLQRMVISPTPRYAILLGKLIGVFTTVLLQLIFLLIAFTVVASLLEGEVRYIWGTNWVAIAALLVVGSLSAASVGMVAAAVSKTPEQANIIGGIVSIFMGALGGAFFPVDTLGAVEPITRLSIVRWGSEAFIELSEGGSDIITNLVFLLLIGAGLFLFSLFAFNRRKDI